MCDACSLSESGLEKGIEAGGIDIQDPRLRPCLASVPSQIPDHLLQSFAAEGIVQERNQWSRRWEEGGGVLLEDLGLLGAALI